MARIKKLIKAVSEIKYFDYFSGNTVGLITHIPVIVIVAMMKIHHYFSRIDNVFCHFNSSITIPESCASKIKRFVINLQENYEFMSALIKSFNKLENTT